MSEFFRGNASVGTSLLAPLLGKERGIEARCWLGGAV